MLYQFSGSQSDIESETNFSVRNQQRRRSRLPAGIATTSGIVASTSQSAQQQLLLQQQQQFHKQQRRLHRGSVKRASSVREYGARERFGSLKSGHGRKFISERDSISEFQNISGISGAAHYGGGAGGGASTSSAANARSRNSDGNINKCNESCAGSFKMSHKSNSTNTSSACSDSTCSDGETTSETTTSSGEPNLPYPGFPEISLKYFTQDDRPRNWCLMLITNPYPF